MRCQPAAPATASGSAHELPRGDERRFPPAELMWLMLATAVTAAGVGWSQVLSRVPERRAMVLSGETAAA